MNYLSVCKILILSSTLVGAFAHSDLSEIQRLKGFAEHQKEQLQFDKGRERGEQAFLEEQESWDRQRQQDLSEYRRQKKAAEMPDDGADAIADSKAKQVIEKDRELARIEQSKNRLRFDRQAQKDLVSEEDELEIYSKRPRYAQKDRVLYGAQAKYAKPSSSSGFAGGSSGGGGGSFTAPPPANFNNHNNNPPNFPPPPSFDEFNDTGGFPPPPDSFGGDFGDDFPPPPPPPPPPMGGDFDFPPPAGEDFGF